MVCQIALTTSASAAVSTIRGQNKNNFFVLFTSLASRGDLTVPLKNKSSLLNTQRYQRPQKRFNIKFKRTTLFDSKGDTEDEDNLVRFVRNYRPW